MITLNAIPDFRDAVRQGDVSAISVFAHLSLRGFVLSGHSMTVWKRFRWCATSAGLALAFSSVAPAMGQESPALALSRPDHVCTNITNSTKQLAMIDSTGDDSFQCLGLSVEGGTVKAIRLETHGIASASRHMDSQQFETTEFPRAVMESRRGAVLDGRPGHDAIVLRGHFPTIPGNMELVISYLYNGITNEYRSCPLSLRWAPDRGWRLANGFGQTVFHIDIITRSVPIVGIIGIANLAGACDEHG
jgi:hypothetical protein